jgi:hypothetical protein
MLSTRIIGHPLAVQDPETLIGDHREVPVEYGSMSKVEILTVSPYVIPSTSKSGPLLPALSMMTVERLPAPKVDAVEFCVPAPWMVMPFLTESEAVHTHVPAGI